MPIPSAIFLTRLLLPTMRNRRDPCLQGKRVQGAPITCWTMARITLESTGFGK